MNAIINEASGERALHHVLELVPYQRVGPAAEYRAHFRESEVMVRFAKDYGFSNIEAANLIVECTAETTVSECRGAGGGRST